MSPAKFHMNRCGFWIFGSQKSGIESIHKSIVFQMLPLFCLLLALVIIITSRIHHPSGHRTHTQPLSLTYYWVCVYIQTLHHALFLSYIFSITSTNRLCSWNHWALHSKFYWLSFPFNCHQNPGRSVTSYEPCVCEIRFSHGPSCRSYHTRIPLVILTIY